MLTLRFLDIQNFSLGLFCPLLGVGRSDGSGFPVDGQTFAVVDVGFAVSHLRELMFLWHVLIISVYNVIVIELSEWTECHANYKSRLKLSNILENSIPIPVLPLGNNPLVIQKMKLL